MKHLIIFLNFCRSRMDHPVYRQFSRDTMDRRDTTLLFLPHPLEERELLHEVTNLRRKEKEKLSDVTFHICADFERVDEAICLAQTIRLIRRLFQADDEHKYQCIAYGKLPNLSDCDEKRIKTIWSNLANINNAVTEYTEFRLVNRIFLYQDESQQSLAEYLYEVIHSQLDIDQITAVPEEWNEWPPIFASFNTAGITYPEEAVRNYLHKQYVNLVLRCSKPEANPTSAEECNEEAKHILSFIPIQNARICLQEEAFINTDAEYQSTWKPVEKFWHDTAINQAQGMNDIPHHDWLDKIKQRIEVIYQSRFRDVGVEYFFQQQQKKTGNYVQILQSIINQEFIRTVQNHPYSPETQKTILRSIVNMLQQKVLELQNFEAEIERSIASSEKQLAATAAEWNSMNFLSRMMKKDDAILDKYTEQIGILYKQKTQLPGCIFAIKLLNELIPTTQDLIDKISSTRVLLDEAILLTDNDVREADPTQALGNFSRQQVEMATQELPKDMDHFLSTYQRLIQFFFSSNPPADSEDLVARVYTHFGENIDQYIKERIDAGTLPPVLNMIITERLKALYADRGGLMGFIQLLKDHSPLNVQLKTNENADHYVLVSPARTDDEEMDYIITDNKSHIQLLHLRQGIRLTDLDGFSGQRMFIEPTIF